MKKVRLIIDSRVNLLKGAMVEVSDQEAFRLFSFGIAEEVKKKEKKKSEEK